jgi:hypothetical protein
MSARFDTVIAVDWSAASVPSPARPSANAIWIAVSEAGGTVTHYARRRSEAVALLVAILMKARSLGRRVLAGFDFPFGYPRGFAEKVVGTASALALWAHLASTLEDHPTNANNRREVAAALNRRLGGEGPFWGNGGKDEIDGLSRCKPDPGERLLPEWRLTERAAPGAKSCWQLSGAGSVGGQALTGLPALERLRRHPGLGGAVRIWPFETGLAAPDASIVFAEIYPSLLFSAVAAALKDGGIKDEVQVRLTADTLRALDQAGHLRALFHGQPSLPPAEADIVASEEGWILGAGHQPILRETASFLLEVKASGARAGLEAACRRRHRS